MLFAQLSHAIGLNDVCDWLRLKSGALSRFGVTPPARNTLSNANKERSADFIEKLFWSVLGHLQHSSPDFATGRKGKGLLRRFKVRIHAVDSTTIQLVANLPRPAQTSPQSFECDTHAISRPLQDSENRIAPTKPACAVEKK